MLKAKPDKDTVYRVGVCRYCAGHVTNWGDGRGWWHTSTNSDQCKIRWGPQVRWGPP